MLTADLHESLRQHVLSTIKSRQMTQSALGELAGMRQAHISNFVLGRRNLSMDGMDAILKALGLDVTSLIVMSGETPAAKDCSPTLESVPLIKHEAAMEPTFRKDEFLAELWFPKVLLHLLNAEPAEKRTDWVRFIALRADAEIAAPMRPRLSNGSVLLLDRHYCSLPEYQEDETYLYLIRKEHTLMVRRIAMQGRHLSLRPDCSEYPLDFICIDRKHPLTSCIVGRVVHIGTELDSPVRRMA
jgi:transcriptional regulator with XRE-family HTH domain